MQLVKQYCYRTMLMRRQLLPNPKGQHATGFSLDSITFIYSAIRAIISNMQLSNITVIPSAMLTIHRANNLNLFIELNFSRYELWLLILYTNWVGMLYILTKLRYYQINHVGQCATDHDQFPVHYSTYWAHFIVCDPKYHAHVNKKAWKS